MFTMQRAVIISAFLIGGTMSASQALVQAHAEVDQDQLDAAFYKLACVQRLGKVETEKSALIRQRKIDCNKRIVENNSLGRYDQCLGDVEIEVPAPVYEYVDPTPIIDNIKVLIEHGADIHAISDYGTALHVCAMASNRLPILGFLLEQKDIKINLQNSWGETALHKAAQHENYGAMRALLLHGADITIQDYNKESFEQLLTTNPQDSSVTQRRKAIAQSVYQEVQKIKHAEEQPGIVAQ